VEPEKKMILVRFLSSYTEWYPNEEEQDTIYKELFEITNSLPTKESIKDSITRLIISKQ
jgi:hypothetical protein